MSETGLDVIVSENKNESHRGTLEYNPVLVELDNGITVIPSPRENLYATVDYEIVSNGIEKSVRRPLKALVKILLSPIITRCYRYFPNSNGRVENIFPPSSRGFYSRLCVSDNEGYDDGSISALYSLHQCPEQKDRLWLTISSPETSGIYESLFIRNYEGNALLMPNDTQLEFALSRRYRDGVPKSELFDVEGFLKGPSPSMSQIAKLVQNVSVPNLSIHGTLQETVSQLVPEGFPENIRESLCVFLGLLAFDMIEPADPDDISVKFAPWRIISSLYNSHSLYTVLNIEPVDYVRLMHLAARNQMQGIGRPVREDIAKSEWLMFWQLLHDGKKNVQDEMSILLKTVEKSNQLGKISGETIPSRYTEGRSRKAWITRLICNSSVSSPSLVCTPNLEALGLHQALYLGSAYCWPHKHMSYITRFGRPSNNTLHLQRMILPTKACIRIKRIIPSLLHVNWSAMTFNPDLYTDRWNVRSEDILKSLSRTKPLTILRRKYYDPSHCDVDDVTPTEAQVLDITTRPFHMMYLKERPYLFERMFRVKKQLFFSSTRSLVERGVMKHQYVLLPQLPTIAVVAHGSPKRIISLADAFLSSTPTCTAYICNFGTNAVILSRVPPSDLMELASTLPQEGRKNGLEIRCFLPDSLRSYNQTLYQRLLKDNGTWDEDVSGFLSQARAKRVEISSVLEREKMGECEA